MKKRILLAGSFMLAVVAATGGYHVFNSNSSLEGTLLMENVEAITNVEIKGNYTRGTYPCPPPVEYKKMVTCKSGGDEDCMPSDC